MYFCHETVIVLIFLLSKVKLKCITSSNDGLKKSLFAENMNSFI